MTKLKQAFTIVEILTIVAIIAALLVSAFVLYTPQLKKSRDAKRKTDLYTIAKALEEYEKDNEAYPAALTQCGITTSGSPLEDYISQVPCDPQTGTNYAYEVGPTATNRIWFRVYSLLENTGDEDIGQLGCTLGCGPGGAFNYYVFSPNTPNLAMVGSFPTIFPTPTGGPTSTATNTPTPTVGRGTPTPTPPTYPPSPTGPVPPLPTDNLVVNPWFECDADPTEACLDHWVCNPASGYAWNTSKHLSQQLANPSTDAEWGTSARWAFNVGQGGCGVGQAGVDAYLYQVVSANPSKTNLKFFTHWVTGEITTASITVSGGNSVTGPWTSVWVPLYVTLVTSSDHAWTNTGFLERNISPGYPFYKIELYGRYDLPNYDGFKVTGVYFAPY